MHEHDAILLAAFDDEPRFPSVSTQAEPRPADRPRPGASMYPETDPISVAIVDSDPEPWAPALNSSPSLPALAFDILVCDPKTASFLLIHSAGTPLGALKPRTLSISATEADSPITSLVIHTRSAADPEPVPYRTFQFSQDIRGKRLTLRFADKADSSSLTIEHDLSQNENGSR